MERTGHKDLLTKLAKEYSRYTPKSAALNKRATQVQVDGGSHAMQLLEPFPPRIVVGPKAPGCEMRTGTTSWTSGRGIMPTCLGTTRRSSHLP